MRCQHCGNNEATMSLRLQVNHQAMQMHICHMCFQEMQGQLTAGKVPTFNTEANNFFQASGGKKHRPK